MIECARMLYSQRTKTKKEDYKLDIKKETKTMWNGHRS